MHTCNYRDFLTFNQSHTEIKSSFGIVRNATWNNVFSLSRIRVMVLVKNDKIIRDFRNVLNDMVLNVLEIK
jgi:hypothetical protein